MSPSEADTIRDLTRSVDSLTASVKANTQQNERQFQQHYEWLKTLDGHHDQFALCMSKLSERLSLCEQRQDSREKEYERAIKDRDKWVLPAWLAAISGFGSLLWVGIKATVAEWARGNSGSPH